MSTVQTFDRNMIKNYLDSKQSWKYLQDQNGNFVVEFARDEDTGCELSLWMTVEGENKSIYAVRVYSDKRISKKDWGRAMKLCNEWNAHKRWGKAFLHINNPDTDTTAQILVEEEIDLETGIHQELLNDFTNTVFVSANNFWTEAHQKGGF
ncbi:hypothetical protein F7734_32720 [Scytonema sp. UIC 10036]|uniref:YbjN domain-containing protein n=1 Tax=Scytonema sp. UIC 10036 TaxID=2304196 RepID=UPI0012DAB477|nr:YbjN domain-containing protein [Scytonema sp. UIC 10036]MUG96850.1 hypothetical protein [Scytonema sp. UIC 10036]